MHLRMTAFAAIASIAVAFPCASFARSARAGDESNVPASTAALAENLVRASLSDDAAVAANAIAALRDLGQPGLDALCAEHDRLVSESQPQAPADATALSTLATLTSPPAPPPSPLDPRVARLRAAIDAVAKQRDAHASRLYWLTDLKQAKSQASASGKPILSLRLLGNLDEDLSCANSRFFRSVLYANAEVSDYLREHFVLHWESLRPVPKLTIDFGDGRRIERTITGNSIHYVLDSSGEIIDAIPGLYGPQAFKDAIQMAEGVAIEAGRLTDRAQRRDYLHAHHVERGAIIVSNWMDDLRNAGVSDEKMLAAIASVPANRSPRAAGPIVPAAAVAAPLAPTKLKLEIPVLSALSPADGIAAAAPQQRAAGLESLMTDALWANIAAMHRDEAELDPRSVALIKSKSPLETAEQAQRRTMAKSFVEDPVVRMLRTLEQSIAADTVRNEYLFHRAIHGWLADAWTEGNAAPTPQGFNRRVYAELFLTPLDDPWMGLAPRDAYAAIDNSGLVDACE